MATFPTPGDELGWRRSVTVEAEGQLTEELGRRLEAASGLRSIGVTDLLAPRQAFWRLSTAPIAISPARQMRIESGRRIHRLLGPLFGPESALEVRVRRQGLAGRIDVLTDRPIELKTATLAIEPEQLVTDRPDHVEQLAMYCALLGRATGRLVTVIAPTEADVEVRTMDVRFANLDAVSSEMQRRAAALRAALTEGNPSDLPRCRWFDRGCEYRNGPTCDCTGREPENASVILPGVSEISARPEVDRWLAPRLSDALRAARPAQITRFRELVYPRRTYFERAEEGPPVDRELAGPPAPPSELYGRLVEAIEAGPVGEVARLPSLAEEPEEEVTAFRGAPFLARTSRSWSAVSAERLVSQYPQYALELGFRCAATGTEAARVMVAYGRAVEPRDRVRVFRLRFTPVTTFARVWRARAAELERARERKTPATLPACPAWMFADCPYRAECGCGEGPDRSHR